MIATNQNPKQLVRDQIDKMLLASGWLVQSKKQINLTAAKGVAIREFQTDIGRLYVKSRWVLLKPSVSKAVLEKCGSYSDRENFAGWKNYYNPKNSLTAKNKISPPVH